MDMQEQDQEQELVQNLNQEQEPTLERRMQEPSLQEN